MDNPDRPHVIIWVLIRGEQEDEREGDLIMEVGRRVRERFEGAALLVLNGHEPRNAGGL